jgi:hypothetical protein
MPKGESVIESRQRALGGTLSAAKLTEDAQAAVAKPGYRDRILAETPSRHNCQRQLLRRWGRNGVARFAVLAAGARYFESEGLEPGSNSRVAK